MVSKRRSIKRQRRQRQQRAYTVKGGERGELEYQKIDDITDNFNGDGSFRYNDKTYNYKYNTNTNNTTGLIKILNSDNSDALCYIRLYHGSGFRKGGVNISQTIIKNPYSILNQDIKDKNINNTFVQAFIDDNNKLKKLKFIKTSDKESSYGTLEEFLIYLEKRYKSDSQVLIDEKKEGGIVSENPSGTGNSPVSSTNYTNDELIKLNETLKTALNCVRIPYDKYNIVIKNVVLYGPTTGGKSRRKISTRQIRDIIKNSIKFGGDGDGDPVVPVVEDVKIPPPPSGLPRQRSQQVIYQEQLQPVQEQLEQQNKQQEQEKQQKQQKEEQKKLKQLQEEQEEQEKLELEKQIQEEINNIIQNITLPNGLKIKSLEIKLEPKYPLGDLFGSGGGKSTRRRRQTRMKTRKQYKSRN